MSGRFSSLSLVSGRDIESSIEPLLDQLLKVQHPRFLFLRLGETQNRPMAGVRGRQQFTVGIYRHRMTDGGEKRQVVMRIGISPACAEVKSRGSRILCAPTRLFVTRHHGLTQASSGAAAAEDEPVGGKGVHAKALR